MFNNLINNSTQFLNICKLHHINYLYAFGSATNTSFTNESDIDLVVEIDEVDPIKKGELIMSLWDNFEIYFQRKVDLLTQNSLRNKYLIQEIENTKILVYDGTKQEIVC